MIKSKINSTTKFIAYGIWLLWDGISIFLFYCIFICKLWIVRQLLFYNSHYFFFQYFFCVCEHFITIITNKLCWWNEISELRSENKKKKKEIEPFCPENSAKAFTNWVLYNERMQYTLSLKLSQCVYCDCFCN